MINSKYSTIVEYYCTMLTSCFIDYKNTITKLNGWLEY